MQKWNLMQDQAKAELKKTLVESVCIDINSDYAGTEFTLKTSGKAELRVPKDDDDLTFLMVFTMNVVSQEQPEAVNIKVVTTFCFELNQLVEDYDEIVREQCLPFMQNWQKEMVNKLIVDMEYPKFFDLSVEE